MNMNMLRIALVGLLSLGAVLAQAGAGKGEPPAPAGQQAREAAAKVPALSPAAREVLAKARELERATRGLSGPERGRALELAAGAYDRAVTELAGEPAAAATAAWSAAQLWRRQGNLALAEKDYLHAARQDPARYGQRGLLGAADMQRRQQRTEEAMQTYRQAAAVDPGSARAQEARLWQARMLLAAEQVDQAITGFQAALESAATPSQGIEAANFLARACIVKGDLAAAERAIEHATGLVDEAGLDDPIEVERLRRAAANMSARKQLQRAKDQQNCAGRDAVRLDEDRRKGK